MLRISNFKLPLSSDEKTAATSGGGDRRAGYRCQNSQKAIDARSRSRIWLDLYFGVLRLPMSRKFLQRRLPVC